jgi:integrase
VTNGLRPEPFGEYHVPGHKNGETICMKGSIFYQNDRGRWAVCFYHEGRPFTITRYRGEFMYHEKIAEKCLAMIQARWEDYRQGKCQFRIEEFTGTGWTDVIEFYDEWLEEVVKGGTKPATYKAYKSYLRNWIRPFFEANPVRLHEIQLDSLNKLKNTIKLHPKGQFNVMNAFHAMMDYAWRARRIPEVPPFPKKREYEIPEPEWSWLTEDQRERVLAEIPAEHRPPILWLIYHFRRPGEACALHKADFDMINNAFWIRRTVSDRQVVPRTKTGKAHYTPCKQEFISIARRLARENPWSPYLFVNSRSRKKEDGGRYTVESLNNIWKAACKKVGVNIPLYHGTKHTSCTLFVTEGGTVDELQILTDHARRDSVLRYTKVVLERKRKMMERGKVVDLDYYKTTTNGKPRVDNSVKTDS